MLSQFGHDPWWLVLVKALGVFAFLMLNVLVAILAERKILGWMQLRPGPNRAGPWLGSCASFTPPMNKKGTPYTAGVSVGFGISPRSQMA